MFGSCATSHRKERADVYHNSYLSKICKRVDKLISKTEDEMFNDWPERASTEVFYGGNDYHLDIRKYQGYIYSSFGYSSCDLVNAFAILTRDGSVLLSDDAKVTFEEDGKLREITKNMVEKKDDERWQ